MYSIALPRLTYPIKLISYNPSSPIKLNSPELSTLRTLLSLNHVILDSNESATVGKLFKFSILSKSK